jgi:hypothetical protein
MHTVTSDFSPELHKSFNARTTPSNTKSDPEGFPVHIMLGNKHPLEPLRDVIIIAATIQVKIRTKQTK